MNTGTYGRHDQANLSSVPAHGQMYYFQGPHPIRERAASEQSIPLASKRKLSSIPSDVPYGASSRARTCSPLSPSSPLRNYPDATAVDADDEHMALTDLLGGRFSNPMICESGQSSCHSANYAQKDSPSVRRFAVSL